MNHLIKNYLHFYSSRFQNNKEEVAFDTIKYDKNSSIFSQNNLVFTFDNNTELDEVNTKVWIKKTNTSSQSIQKYNGTFSLNISNNQKPKIIKKNIINNFIESIQY